MCGYEYVLDHNELAQTWNESQTKSNLPKQKSRIMKFVHVMCNYKYVRHQLHCVTDMGINHCCLWAEEMDALQTLICLLEKFCLKQKLMEVKA